MTSSSAAKASRPQQRRAHRTATSPTPAGFTPVGRSTSSTSSAPLCLSGVRSLLVDASSDRKLIADGEGSGPPTGKRLRAEGSALRCAVVAVLALQVGWGCAFRSPDPAPPAFDRVALRSEVAMKDGRRLEGDLQARSTIRGALVGGGSLALLGGGIGAGVGLECGPFAVFCSPILGAMGGVAGGAIGVVGGTVGGLPWKTTTQVNDILVDLQSRRDFTQELGAALAAAVPKDKQAEPGHAESTVVARLDEVKLRQHMRERLSIRMWASMTQEWVEHGKVKKKTSRYTYTTPVAGVEDWLLQDGKMFGDSLTQGIDMFARWMAQGLEASSTPSAQRETSRALTTRFHG